MTASPYDLTTVSTLQGYLTPSSDDTVLMQRLITAASKAIQSYVNRDIVALDYVESYDGNDGAVMLLPNYPINSVASVTIDGETIPVGDFKTRGYRFTQNQLILNGYRFCKGMGNVTVSYNAGYSTVPENIEQFCIGTVQYWMNDRKRGGEVSQTMGGQTIAYSQKDMPEWVKTGLAQIKAVFAL